jgi:hypothetical protein
MDTQRYSVNIDKTTARGAFFSDKLGLLAAQMPSQAGVDGAALIARTFPFPASAGIQGNRISPDPQAGVGCTIEAAIKNAPWRM